MKIKIILAALAPCALGACATLFPASPFAYDKKGDLVEFNYAWSAEASRTPVLARRLRANLEREFNIAAGAAEAERTAARAAGKTFAGNLYSRRWTTAGQSSRLLSLEGRLKTRDGSGVVIRRADGLLWDRSARAEIGFERLFEGTNIATMLVRAPGCAANRNASPACLSTVTVVPVDTNRNRRFDEFRLVVPSRATVASDADAGKDVSIPITPTMLAALKPVYRPGFEVGQPQ
jgi:hypothetical protein